MLITRALRQIFAIIALKVILFSKREQWPMLHICVSSSKQYTQKYQTKSKYFMIHSDFLSELVANLPPCVYIRIFFISMEMQHKCRYWRRILVWKLFITIFKSFLFGKFQEQNSLQLFPSRTPIIQMMTKSTSFSEKYHKIVAPLTRQFFLELGEFVRWELCLSFFLK